MSDKWSSAFRTIVFSYDPQKQNPNPLTIFNTPFGRTEFNISTILIAPMPSKYKVNLPNGASSADFTTSEFPQTRAGAIFNASNNKGAFHYRN